MHTRTCLKKHSGSCTYSRDRRSCAQDLNLHVLRKNKLSPCASDMAVPSYARPTLSSLLKLRSPNSPVSSAHLVNGTRRETTLFKRDLGYPGKMVVAACTTVQHPQPSALAHRQRRNDVHRTIRTHPCWSPCCIGTCWTNASLSHLSYCERHHQHEENHLLHLRAQPTERTVSQASSGKSLRARA